VHGFRLLLTYFYNVTPCSNPACCWHDMSDDTLDILPVESDYLISSTVGNSVLLEVQNCSCHFLSTKLSSALVSGGLAVSSRLYNAVTENIRSTVLKICCHSLLLFMPCTVIIVIIIIPRTICCHHDHKVIARVHTVSFDECRTAPSAADPQIKPPDFCCESVRFMLCFLCTWLMLFVDVAVSQGTQSANPHNDYCQHFVDTGERPQNFIRDVGLCITTFQHFLN